MSNAGSSARTIRRLTVQVEIANAALRAIAACGCAACGPALSAEEARVVADDALTRIDTVE